MSKPLVIVIPHQLGRAEARRRLETGIVRLKDTFAGKFGDAEQTWSGDHLDLKVAVMSQQVTSALDVGDDHVRLEVKLPWMLAFLADKAKGLIQKQGALMLEKK